MAPAVAAAAAATRATVPEPGGIGSPIFRHVDVDVDQWERDGYMACEFAPPTHIST